MTVLNLHKKECLEIAKRILDWNFINPILVKTNSRSHMDTLMIIDGKKLAEKLELEIKSSLERSDLSNSYLVEFDFDNPNLQSDSLFFEKIIESAVFYQVPESISEANKDLQWFKKVIEGNEYSKEGLRQAFGIVEVNPKLNLQSLDLVIASPIEVETVFLRRTTNTEVGRFQQYILPHERGFEPSVEIRKHYITKQFERKHQVQILSTKTITTKRTEKNFDFGHGGRNQSYYFTDQETRTYEIAVTPTDNYIIKVTGYNLQTCDRHFKVDEFEVLGMSIVKVLKLSMKTAGIV